MEAHFRHLFLFWSDKNWVYMRANRCLTKSTESSIRVFSNIIQSESGAYLMCSRQHIRDREILVMAANWTLRPLPCYFSLLSNCICLRTRVRSLDFWNYLTTQNHALTSAKYTSKQAHAPEGTQQWVFAPDDIAVSSLWKFNNWVDVRRHISLDQPCWGETGVPCHVSSLCFTGNHKIFTNCKYNGQDPCTSYNCSFYLSQGCFCALLLNTVKHFDIRLTGIKLWPCLKLN